MSEYQVVLEGFITDNHKSYDGLPHLHIYDREHFNSVDLHDKFYHSCRYYFGVNSWRAKLLVIVLDSAVVNEWVLFQEGNHSLEFPVFRERVVSILWVDVENCLLFLC